MKNTIIRFGLISGVISAALLFCVTLIFKYIGFEKIGLDYSAIFGYGAIIISMSIIYFGIKSFRNTQNEGSFSFGKGFLIGLGILLISCVFYSLAWLVIYYNFIPTFMDDYAQACIKKATLAGASQAELSKTITDLDQMKEWYKSPIKIFALSALEPTPVGLLVTIISAFVLKKK